MKTRFQFNDSRDKLVTMLWGCIQQLDATEHIPYNFIHDAIFSVTTTYGIPKKYRDKGIVWRFRRTKIPHSKNPVYSNIGHAFLERLRWHCKSNHGGSIYAVFGIRGYYVSNEVWNWLDTIANVYGYITGRPTWSDTWARLLGHRETKTETGTVTHV